MVEKEQLVTMLEGVEGETKKMTGIQQEEMTVKEDGDNFIEQEAKLAKVDHVYKSVRVVGVLNNVFRDEKDLNKLEPRISKLCDG